MPITARAAAATRTTETVLSLVMNMALIAPSVSAATVAEAAIASVFPTATSAAAPTTLATRPGGGAAEVTQSESNTADNAAGIVMPHLDRRRAKASRADTPVDLTEERNKLAEKREVAARARTRYRCQGVSNVSAQEPDLAARAARLA